MVQTVIYGTGGFSKEVYQVLLDKNDILSIFADKTSKIDFLGFIDDNSEKHGKCMYEKPILGGLDWLAEHPTVNILVAIGNPSAKLKVIEKIKNSIPSAKFASLIHPSTLIGENVTIGEGVIMCAESVITTDITIGSYVTINKRCTIGHDVSISDFSTLAPSCNVGGNVKVGIGCELGMGSIIIQEQTIGDWTTIGAGSVVIRDVPSHVTSVGNPSKVIKEHERIEIK